ncbi:MAG TPA: hypothetical protein VID72_01165, partial [Ktedonobacterales bacterium]
MDTPPQREASADGHDSDALRAARLEALQRLASPMSRAPRAAPTAQEKQPRIATGARPGAVDGPGSGWLALAPLRNPSPAAAGAMAPPNSLWEAHAPQAATSGSGAGA